MCFYMFTLYLSFYAMQLLILLILNYELVHTYIHIRIQLDLLYIQW